MRLLHLSDIHGRVDSERILRAFNELKADIIVISGDSESSSLLRDLAGRTRVFYVSGNMDSISVVETARELGMLLDGEVLDVEGILLAGIGRREEHDLNRIRKEVKGDWILVSHYPPLDTKADIASSGRHVGSRIIRNAINELKPKACLCGHIHESPAIFRLNDTIVVNPGPAFMGRAAIIDTENWKADFTRI
ncbi:MAG: metallophosphoesterase [Thermoproteota archaeon]|jgi:putative phosphoesterase|uniref:Metallophosphoesterase n=1 Tax=Candidatus Methanodesulfokora washburnensis TaxID=2478471 RepID=A0A520KJQ3_9CREN|nr:MAG: metallophosphoesterase [Candidatus Methanodesulfokores washburnensis]TDA40122.1 MAG: metallophosphoesterase [Candidatus Korarchaeota archaeon]